MGNETEPNYDLERPWKIPDQGFGLRKLREGRKKCVSHRERALQQPESQLGSFAVIQTLGNPSQKKINFKEDGPWFF